MKLVSLQELVVGNTYVSKVVAKPGAATTSREERPWTLLHVDTHDPDLTLLTVRYLDAEPIMPKVVLASEGQDWYREFYER